MNRVMLALRQLKLCPGLSFVVLGASYWPARRASQVAPMEALRHE